MTTSITDARFTHLHATPEYILSLLIDEKPDSSWQHVMPGFDENLDIPASLEPPRLDADEVLPSQLHPSYPFGRPKGDKGKTAGAGGNLRAIAGNMMPQDEERRWSELNLTAVVERPDGREVPPVMAHLRRHLERQRQATPAAPPDPFDAPVPNETYAEDDPDNPINAEMEGMDTTPE